MVMFFVKTSKSQVCISVGCIPPALVAATRCQFWGMSVRDCLCPGISVKEGLTPGGSMSKGKTLLREKNDRQV